MKARAWLAPLFWVSAALLPLFSDCRPCLWFSALVVIGLGLRLAWHRNQLDKLQSWFESPDNVLPEVAEGRWEDMFSIAYRWRKQEETRRQLLKRRLAHFHEAMDALPDALLILDGDGQIVWANHACDAMLGLRWPQDRGQPLSYLVRHPRFLAFFEKGAQATQIPAPGEPGHTLEGNRYPLPDGGSLMLFRDVTRLLHLEKVRQDFVANISHELRSPLTVIGGFIETLQDHQADDAQISRYLQLMAEEAARMQALVNDLLILARLDAPALLRETLEPVALADLVTTALAALQSQLEAKQLVIHLDLDPHLHIQAQHNDMMSVLRNLIENAVKYTPAGREIRIGWNVQGDLAVFSVEDSGEGIAPEHLGRLTERFYRVDAGRSRAMGGTGLGLAIVKHVVARYEGELRIHSEIGVGSCFQACFAVHDGLPKA